MDTKTTYSIKPIWNDWGVWNELENHWAVTLQLSLTDAKTLTANMNAHARQKATTR